ncbi:MAG TPA: glycosyltransferase [Pirellulales bacterium]|nr:glycosyltransferase [Pirellulales bacterium]
MRQSGGERRLAVQLGPADSIFPAILAEAWRKRGWEVAVVSSSPSSHWLPNDVPVTGAGAFRGDLDRVGRKLARRVLRRVERVLVAAGRRRFRRITGKPEPAGWECRVIDTWAAGPALAKLALSLSPSFVFAHDAAAYGPALALCRGVPRILFPWGSDIYNTPESWAGAAWIVTRAMRGADLIVPSSQSAADYIQIRFGVAPDKVRAISWGIDLAGIGRAETARREALCAKWRIPGTAVVVQNCRKFWPHFGCFTILEAFLRIAAELPQCHFVLFGGVAAGDVREAAARIAQAGLSSRFTLIDRQLDLPEYLEMSSISDVYVSICPRGDARSSSVLQLAGAGAAPVIGEDAEYRALTQLGFKARFVDPHSVDDLVAAIRHLVLRPELRREMAVQNDIYLREHEDRDGQMDILLSAIEELVAARRGEQPACHMENRNRPTPL